MGRWRVPTEALRNFRFRPYSILVKDPNSFNEMLGKLGIVFWFV